MKRPPDSNSFRDRWCSELAPELAGTEVGVAGWVHRRRDHSELLFIELRDRSGLVQLVIDCERPELDEDVRKLARELRPEDVLSAHGTLIARAPENINPKLPTGTVELQVERLQLLSGAKTPPFPVDDERVSVNELPGMRHRPVLLRRASMRDGLIMRHELVARIREVLSEHDFLEVETPILTRSTPEGARDFLVPSRRKHGAWYALPQSPQLFKQMLMVAGLERYYQIARCFRDEDLRADRQPEFTQLDLEMAFVTEKEVMGITETVMAAVFECAGFELPPPPWRQLTYQDAISRYGSDRPDTRFALELREVTQQLSGSEFGVFQNVIDAGGTVLGLNIGKNPMSNSQVQSLVPVVAGYGAGGVAPITVGPGGEWTSTLGRFFAPEHERTVNETLAASEGDQLLFVADRPRVAVEAAGALRLELAKRLGLLDGQAHEILWVVDFPMFAWEERTKQWTSLHHPFTAPAGEDQSTAEVNLEDPGSLRSRAYDLVLDGVEIGGGSIRIHDPQLQLRVLQTLGIDEQRARSRFGFLLEALQYGAPPHGGIALGIDRIVALCAGRESIRDVIAFPKTASGVDPLTGAPAEVDPQQLRELGIRPNGLTDG